MKIIKDSKNLLVVANYQNEYNEIESIVFVNIQYNNGHYGVSIWDKGISYSDFVNYYMMSKYYQIDKKDIKRYLRYGAQRANLCYGNYYFHYAFNAIDEDRTMITINKYFALIPKIVKTTFKHPNTLHNNSKILQFSSSIS